MAVGFLVVAVLVGRFLVPRLFDLVVRMRVRYVLLVFAVAFALGLSALAALAGSALIIGAFAAGLILSGTNQFDTIEHEVRPVASIFTPDLLRERRRVGQSRGCSNPASAGGARHAGRRRGADRSSRSWARSAAGWAAPWVRFRRLVVGVGMVPRGEVGLIFADIGRRSGVLSEEVFGAVLLMVMATTFVAPPALKALFGAAPAAGV